MGTWRYVCSACACVPCSGGGGSSSEGVFSRAIYGSTWAILRTAAAAYKCLLIIKPGEREQLYPSSQGHLSPLMTFKPRFSEESRRRRLHESCMLTLSHRFRETSLVDRFFSYVRYTSLLSNLKNSSLSLSMALAALLPPPLCSFWRRR